MTTYDTHLETVDTTATEAGRSRTSEALGTAKAKATDVATTVREAAPRTARRAGRVVRENPAPTAAVSVLVIAGTVVAVVFGRRAAKARAARNRWRPGFLKR